MFYNFPNNSALTDSSSISTKFYISSSSSASSSPVPSMCPSTEDALHSLSLLSFPFDLPQSTSASLFERQLISQIKSNVKRTKLNSNGQSLSPSRIPIRVNGSNGASITDPIFDTSKVVSLSTFSHSNEASTRSRTTEQSFSKSSIPRLNSAGSSKKSSTPNSNSSSNSSKKCDIYEEHNETKGDFSNFSSSLKFKDVSLTAVLYKIDL